MTNQKEQEAQQAQTIARIKDEYAKHAGRTYNAFMDFAPLTTELYENLGALLEIVDSQAQKIAEQAKEIERLKNALSTAEWHGEPTPRKIYRPDLATIIPDSAGGVLTDSKEAKP